MKKKYMYEMIVCIGIFAVLAVFVSQLSPITASARILPLAYILASAGFTFLLFVQNLLRYRKETDDQPMGEKLVFWSVLVYAAIIAAYIFLMKYISYILSTYLFILGSLLYLKIKNKWLLAVLPIAVTLILYFMFTRLLYVFPPSGTIIKLKWY